MYLTQGSYAEKILISLCLSGEFPYYSMYILEDTKHKSHRMFVRNAKKLKDNGYISITGSGSEKTMRLRQKGKDVVSERFPSLYSNYLLQTDKGVIRTGKSNASDLWRKHRLAETLVMLQKAGIYFLDSQKPSIDNQSVYEAIELPEGYGFFYSSKQMKSVDKVASYKVSFTRVLGMLSTKEEHFGVYNTNEGLMKRNNQGENKAKKMMEDLVNISFDSDKRQIINSAIMFGRNYDIARKILNSRAHRKDSRGFEFLSFDNTFSDMYFLTIDDYGLLGLQLLLLPDRENRLNELVFEGYDRNQGGLSFSADFYDQINHCSKLNFLSGNIGKLKRFVNASRLNKDMKFEIYCFPFQEKFLREFCPKYIKINTVDLSSIYNNLLS